MNLTRTLPAARVEVDVVELEHLRAQVEAARLLVELLTVRKAYGLNYVLTKPLQRAARALALPVPSAQLEES